MYVNIYIYDISHYAYDINDKCSLKYVSKSRNHIALIYYAINDHMYLLAVNEDYKESLVKKTIAMDHTINASLLESVEKVNSFDESEIIENIDFNDVEDYNK